jgi:hypothetical protein
MNRIHPLPQLAVVAFALLRGVGEFAALQRWRLQAWLARRLS